MIFYSNKVVCLLTHVTEEHNGESTKGVIYSSVFIINISYYFPVNN